MVRIYRLLFVCLSVIIPFSLTQAQEPNVKSTTVILETTQGNIELTLFADQARKPWKISSVLLKKATMMVRLFHRVIKGFHDPGRRSDGDRQRGTSLWGSDFADEIKPALSFDKQGI